MRRPALLLLVPLLVCGCAPPAPERIVLVVVDTLRRDHVGVYGAERPTPHIDALAEGGTVFTRAVASFHSTPTSMGALFTGRAPSLESHRPRAALPWSQQTWCGLARFAEVKPGEAPDSCVPAGLDTLAEILAARGWWTIGVHSHPLLRTPTGFEQGFRQWVQIRGAPPRLAFGPRSQARFAEARSGEHVNAAVAKALDARESDHFFLYVHYLDAHDWDLLGISYAEAVAAADARVGELLGLLEERGLREGSAVVLTSDHGESLRESHFMPPRHKHAGNPSFETVLRVPLVVGGATLDGADDLVRGDDTFRLILRLAGAGEGTPEPVQEPEEQLVTEVHYRTYRQGRWKSFWPRAPGRPRLVDLEADPGERRDVAAEHPEVLEAHRVRIETLARRLTRDDDALEVPEEIDPEQREHLRTLGYLEPAYDLDAPLEAP